MERLAGPGGSTPPNSLSGLFILGGNLTMPVRGYRELLLREAADAAVRAKWAKDQEVRASWQRIEMAYREAARSVGIEDHQSASAAG